MTTPFGFRFGLAAAAMFALPSLAYAQSSGTWTVGEIAAMSGPAATVGVRLNQVTKMWVDEVNKGGGIRGHKIELITCDDSARPEKAVACARDLLAKHVVLLFNNSLTASILAVEPLVKNGPAMIVPSPNITPPADSYVFQVSPSDLYLTIAIADFLKANNIKKLGMVAATDASGEVGVASAKKVFPAQGIALKLTRIDLRATDASTQLASVASNDVKVIYSSYSGGGAATVVKSYHNLGLQQPLIVSYANLSDAFVSVVKNELPPHLLGTSIKALVPDLLNDAGERQRTLAFRKEYHRVYGGLPDMINLLGKLNVDVADAVLKNVKDPSDARAVKRYLEATPVNSVQTIRFSPTSHVGLKESDVIIAELKNGVWAKADPIR
jgi:ABC-type branched-subunit amino acid transport system substrate-binding protein